VKSWYCLKYSSFQMTSSMSCSIAFFSFISRTRRWCWRFCDNKNVENTGCTICPEWKSLSSSGRHPLDSPKAQSIQFHPVGHPLCRHSRHSSCNISYSPRTVCWSVCHTCQHVSGEQNERRFHAVCDHEGKEYENGVHFAIYVSQEFIRPNLMLRRQGIVMTARTLTAGNIKPSVQYFHSCDLDFLLPCQPPQFRDDFQSRVKFAWNCAPPGKRIRDLPPL
jgi:hypothetical protein